MRQNLKTGTEIRIPLKINAFYITLILTRKI